MKKFLLSISFAALFVIYGVTMRTVNSAAQSTAHASPAANKMGDDRSETAAPPATITAPQPAPAQGRYKDGTFAGNVADAFYGPLQVAAVIQSGRISDVQILQYPNDRENSVFINGQALPVLKDEAIRAQQAQVDGVTGATDTGLAFMESLASALAKAQ